MADNVFTIGYSSLAESIPSVAFRTEQLRQIVAEHPDLALIVRDNDMDDEKALAHAQGFVSHPVDLAIIFHINERLGSELGVMFKFRQIPLIAIDIPISMSYYFGVNNSEAGHLTGDALGQWVVENWDGEVDKVLLMTEQRVTSVLHDRIESALGGFLTHIDVSQDNRLYLDSGHSRRKTCENTIEVLENWTQHEKIAVIAINDDVALGVLEAARSCGRENHIALAGLDATPEAQAEILNPTSQFIASTNVHLENYAPRLVDLALRIRDGERIPAKNYVPLSCFTITSGEPTLDLIG